MRKYAIAGAFVVACALPGTAWAKFFVVVDTVKNCSVVAEGYSAGMTPLGNKDGYETKEAAQEFLKTVREDAAQCVGVVE